MAENLPPERCKPTETCDEKPSPINSAAAMMAGMKSV